ncbi:MAG: histidine kinase N-terminal 7TM domain-containing protein [Candidatus Promineifilaceae bacterium]
MLIAYSYSMLLAGTVQLLRMGRKLPNPFRAQTYALVVAATFPWLGNGLYVSGFNPLPYLDWTPVGFALTAVVLGWTLRRLRLLNIAPIAREVVFDNIADAVLVWNESRRLIDLNQAAVQLFHINFPDDIGITIDEVFSGPFAPLNKLAFSPTETKVVDIVHQNGHTVFEASFSPILNHKGEDYGRLLILRNITESQAARQALTYQKQLFENLVKIARATTHSPNLTNTMAGTLNITIELTQAETGSIMLLNENHEIIQSILANRDTTQIKKEKNEKTVLKKGLAGWILQHGAPALIRDTKQDSRWIQLPGQPYKARSVLGYPIKRHQTIIGLLFLVHSNPDHFTNSTLELIEAASDQIALALNTAQMYAAEQNLVKELAFAKEEAETANKAKSAFLANISHELRTPLAAMIGYSELIQELLPPETKLETIQKYLQKIYSSGTHLQTLIDEILEISRIESGKVTLHNELCDMDNFIHDVLQTVQPLILKNNNTLQINLPNQLGSFITDPLRLRQILLNLLSNAAKFTQEGTITFSAKKTDTSFIFEVADTGIGVSPEQAKIIFQPFIQADESITRKYGGTGLGLAISQHFSRLLGGAITVQSEIGKGSAFTLTLPIVTETEAQPS